MNTQWTEIFCVIARSGWMDAVRNDPKCGFNLFLRAQKDAPGEARLSLALFDSEYDLILDGAPIQDIPELPAETYVPRGSTALLDAVGKSINHMATRLSRAAEIPAKVVFCILTDGEENASQEFTRDQLFERITRQKINNGWEFVFLAANHDAFASGASICIAPSDNIKFQATVVGLAGAYQRMSDEILRHRSKI